MFNIANFSSHIGNYGTLQTNKFIVRLRAPLVFGPTGNDRVFEYRAKSVKIPGVNLDLQTNNSYGVGPQQRFPTNVSFSEIDITFIDTATNSLWKYFTKWFNQIFDYTGSQGGSRASYSVEYKKYYETEVQIFVYDNEGNQTNVIVLKQAFPTSLSDVGLSWSENNQLYEFSVKFSFKEWYYDAYRTNVFESGAELGPGISAQVLPQPSESPRSEIGLDPNVNIETNPYAPRNNPLTSPSGMNFGLLSG